MTTIKQYPMVLGTSTTEGQASLLVDGTVTPFLGWSTITSSDAVRYVITDGVQFEEGRGAVSSGPTLSRTTVLRTSNGDTTKIDWGTGTRQVYVVPDLDTVFTYDDNGYIRLLVGTEYTNETGGDYRFYDTENGFFFADTTDGDPFDLVWAYNRADETPTVKFTKPVSINGNPVNTWIKATSGQLSAGTNDESIVTPAGVAAMMDVYARVIGSRAEVSDPALADELLLGVGGATLGKTALSAFKALFNVPDFEQTGITVESEIKSYSHSLGAEPQRVEAQLRCIETDIGFAVGDVLPLYSTDTTSSGWAATLGKNATTVWYVMGPDWGTRRKDTGAPTAIDYTRWQGELRAWL